jgi:hypothetical protein
VRPTAWSPILCTRRAAYPSLFAPRSGSLLRAAQRQPSSCRTAAAKDKTASEQARRVAESCLFRRGFRPWRASDPGFRPNQTGWGPRPIVPQHAWPGPRPRIQERPISTPHYECTPIKNPSVGNAPKLGRSGAKSNTGSRKHTSSSQGLEARSNRGQVQRVTASIRLCSRMRRSNGRPCDYRKLGGMPGARGRTLAPASVSERHTGLSFLSQSPQKVRKIAKETLAYFATFAFFARCGIRSSVHHFQSTFHPVTWPSLFTRASIWDTLVRRYGQGYIR